jgi:hypothetical protein
MSLIRRTEVHKDLHNTSPTPQRPFHALVQRSLFQTTMLSSVPFLSLVLLPIMGALKTTATPTPATSDMDLAERRLVSHRSLI